MALTERQLRANLNSIPDTISLHQFSDAGISATSFSRESMNSCRFQPSLGPNNMGHTDDFANTHENPTCVQSYPQNAGSLPNDSKFSNYSALQQNEVMAQRSRRPPNRRRDTTRTPDEIAAKRKLASHRERERNKKLAEGINILHKRIYLKSWEKPTVRNILKAASLYIEFLQEKLANADSKKYEFSSEAHMKEKLRNDFEKWRIKKESKDFSKPI